MAMRTKLDEMKQNTVVTLVSVGVSQRQAAMHVGCDASTMTKLATRDEDFAEQMRDARRRAQQEPLELIRKHADKSWRAAAWLLEKSHPHLYGKQAGKVNEQALEEQRIELVQILADEIGDAELLDRIIDRLHQLEEAKLSPLEEAAPAQDQTMKEDSAGAEACVPQQADVTTVDPPPQEACASRTISDCQSTPPIAKVESNEPTPAAKACSKAPWKFNWDLYRTFGGPYAPRASHADTPPCGEPTSKTHRSPHSPRRGRQKRPGRR